MSGDTRQPQGQIPLLGRPFVYLRHGETTSNRDAMIAGALEALPPYIETADAFFSRVARGMAAIPMPEAGWLPVVAAHSGVWRVLCRLVGIQAAQAPIGNAVPMRISPSPSGGWRVDSV